MERPVLSLILLAGRDSAQDIFLEDKRVFAGSGGSPTQVLDPGEARISTALQADLSDFVRVLDSLEFCDFIVNPLHPTDIPEEKVPIQRFFASLSNTTKRVMGGWVPSRAPGR